MYSIFPVDRRGISLRVPQSTQKYDFGVSFTSQLYRCLGSLFEAACAVSLWGCSALPDFVKSKVDHPETSKSLAGEMNKSSSSGQPCSIFAC
jgi:hypothetical protein